MDFGPPILGSDDKVPTPPDYWVQASNDCHEMILGHEHAGLTLRHFIIFFLSKIIANHKSEDMLQQWPFLFLFLFL